MTWLLNGTRRKRTEEKGQKKRSTTSHLIIFLFSLSFFFCLHGHFGVNKMVCMCHFIFLSMRDLILLQRKMKFSSYGLLTELVSEIR